MILQFRPRRRRVTMRQMSRHGGPQTFKGSGMNDSRKKPGFLFWATILTVVIAVTGAYLLSYPWTCAFLIRNDLLDSPVSDAADAFYVPFGWIFSVWPESLRDLYIAYND